MARDLQESVFIQKMMSDASGVDNSTCGISAAVVVGLLHEEPEPIEWKGLHVRALRGINCKRMQTLLTNVLLRLWEWQFWGSSCIRLRLRPGWMF